MKPSLQKLQKFFKLEAERGYDNHAVVGGLERILDLWESEARADGLSEDLIQSVVARIRDYGRLSERSRAEALQGLWKRIQRSETEVPAGTPFEALLPVAPEVVPRDQTPGEPAENIERPVIRAGASSVPALARKRPSGGPEPMHPTALNAPITVLQGIGPRNAENLQRVGIRTLRDMLYYFPRRYDDYSKLKPINRLNYGEEVTVIGTVQRISSRPIRGGKATLIEALVSDGSGVLRVTWFNQEWIARRLHEGAQVVISGKIDQHLGRPVITNPEWEPLEQQHLNTNRIVPVYPLTAQVTQHWLRRQMHQLVTFWAPRIIDPLPEQILQEADLVDLPTALLQVHFPDSWETLKAAQHRLAFDEIFLLQIGVLQQKRAWQEREARRYSVDQSWLEDQIARLPFSLTKAQERALNDLRHDLASGRPTNRLIQGDVGSGKTVIAALAIAIVTSSGAQASMMAPTSILAEQHYRNLLKLLTEEIPQSPATELTPAPLKPEEIRLLVGATPESEKRQILQGLADGDIKLLIGTHALIEDPVIFKDLQLVVVDEQHRFGVEQRALLRAKGDNPHLIVMTATPIPRSLALTIYGDLDLTVLDEMPPGRQPVSTHILMPRERERAYSLIRHQAQEGFQAFIVYPLIEESNNSDVRAAAEEYERLKSEVFPDLKIGLLHGRMKADEKEAVLSAFRNGEYHILVSTTVIEVGMDIPNATIMLIEGANRYGLAQLHQLRGRVGRGSDKSYCLLIPESADDIENERLQVMASTNDGFELAERDLEQRGPGEFLGTRQAGFSDLSMANLSDLHLIEKARRHALALFERDPDLNQPENQPLASTLQQFWRGEKGDIS